MVTKRFEVRLDEETHEDLSELAEERHVSLSEVVREAIRLLREQDDRERRRRAVEELCAMEIEDVPEPDELSRQLASTYDVPDIP